MNIDPMNRHADLAGMVKPTFRQRFDEPVEFGTAVDDCRRGAAVLQRASRSRWQFGPEIPADAARTDETQKGDAGIGRERLCELVGLGKKSMALIGRQPGLVKQACEIHAGERRVRRRLDDHRGAYGDRRHDLMDDQVQGVIERGDGGGEPDRFESREGPPIDARRRQPHQNFPAAAHDAQLVHCIAYAVNGAVGFDQRIGQWLTALTRDLATEMLALTPPSAQPASGASRSADGFSAGVSDQKPERPQSRSLSAL